MRLGIALSVRKSAKRPASWESGCHVFRICIMTKLFSLDRLKKVSVFKKLIIKRKWHKNSFPNSFLL
jgi:hypothetical protein